MRDDQGLTYQAAGVNIDKGNQAVDLFKPLVAKTQRPEVMGGLGGFGALFALDTQKYPHPVLVSGTDGVGTKLVIAQLTGNHATIGIDCVAMCVNDILVSGAEPLFFLDYLAVGRLDPEQVAQIVGGVAEGCLQAGCSLSGGETAEMPGFYRPGEYDVAGFAVGVVERERIINGSAIREGDVVLGLPSRGLHSNGYSLVRKIFLEKCGWNIGQYIPEFGCALGEELIKPTRIYVKLIQEILERFTVKGMAHITGGGLLENPPRILPPGVRFELDYGSWPIPSVFTLLAKEGNVAPLEMLRTFNMGIGFVLTLEVEEARKLQAWLVGQGEAVFQIGRVIKGQPGVDIRGLP